jgi:hypothetical protein
MSDGGNRKVAGIFRFFCLYYLSAPLICADGAAESKKIRGKTPDKTIPQPLFLVAAATL